MKKFYQYLLLLISIRAGAAYSGPPMSAEFNLEKLGHRFQAGPDSVIWESQFFLNQGDRGIGIASEGERSENFTEGHEVKLFYSHHAENQRDWQAGWYTDVKAEHERHWLFALTSFVLPASIELESTLFISDDQLSALELKFTRGIAITNRWFFHPEVEVIAYDRNDDKTGTGAGLSTVEAELRLGYKLQPKLSSFISATWEKSYGQTADYRIAEGEKLEYSSVLVGIALNF